MKTLISTILTNENQSFLNDWLKEMVTNHLPKDIIIVDNRSSGVKFNDSVDKIIKKYINAGLIRVRCQSDYNSCFKIILNKAKSNYFALFFSKMELKITGDTMISLVMDCEQKNAVVPIITNFDGYVSEKLILSQQDVYAMPLSDLPSDEDIAVAKNCFVINQRVINKLNIVFSLREDLSEDMFLHYFFAENGVRFSFSENFAILN